MRTQSYYNPGNPHAQPQALLQDSKSDSGTGDHCVGCMACCCLAWFRPIPRLVCRASFFAAELDQGAESMLFAGVSPKVLDVHVLVNAKEDLKMRSEYDIPAGVVRFRDFEKSFGVKVLEYAVSTSDAAPGTEDYKAAVGKKALPSNSTSLWLKAKREGATTYYT